MCYMQPELLTLINTDDNWLEHLAGKGIKASWDADKRLVSLKYSIDAGYDSLTRECRGVVVHAAERRIMSYGYKRFANHGESWADPIDWESAYCLDKVDGSLIFLFWDNDHWTVASSGHPTAGGAVWPGTQTFAELFWQTFADLKMQLPDTTGKLHHPGSACFMFELCTMSNRIVVRHETPRIVFHGARHLVHDKLHHGFHWQEWSRPALEGWGDVHNWEVVKAYPLTNLDECMVAVNELNPTQNEGFVVVDKHFNRVKIKSPQYVALHHLKDSISTEKNMVTIVMTGEKSELLNAFPELTNEFVAVEAKLGAALAKLEDLYAQNRHLESQKDFALAIAGKSKMTGILFQARKNKTEVKDVWMESKDLILKALF